jgi:hypothetical protein
MMIAAPDFPALAFAAEEDRPALNSFPDDFKIYLEITMRQCVAHFIGECQW